MNHNYRMAIAGILLAVGSLIVLAYILSKKPPQEKIIQTSPSPVVIVTDAPGGQSGGAGASGTINGSQGVSGASRGTSVQGSQGSAGQTGQNGQNATNPNPTLLDVTGNTLDSLVP